MAHLKKMTREEFDAPEVRVEDLPPDEQETLRKKKEALDKFFASEIVAKYKIEVQFGKGRSVHTHFPGSLHCYRSGSALSGGGDEILYPCPDNKCPGYIEPEHVAPQFAFCPVCQQRWDRIQDMQEGRMFRLDHSKWAEVILRAFTRLGHNADVYLKSHPEDIRDKALLEQMKQCRGEEYAKAHRQRVYVMYSLSRIIKDAHAGKDLYKLFLALVTA